MNKFMIIIVAVLLLAGLASSNSNHPTTSTRTPASTWMQAPSNSENEFVHVAAGPAFPVYPSSSSGLSPEEIDQKLEALSAELVTLLRDKHGFHPDATFDEATATQMSTMLRLLRSVNDRALEQELLRVWYNFQKRQLPGGISGARSGRLLEQMRAKLPLLKR